MDQDSRRLFCFPFKFLSGVNARKISVSISGVLFGLGILLFLDCMLYSKFANESSIRFSFVDWIPILFVLSGMFLMTSIGRGRLAELSFSNGSFIGGGHKNWQVEFLLFMSVAQIGGGYAGSISLYLIKYMGQPVGQMGVYNVLSNTLIVASSLILLTSANMEEEYSYSLAL